MRQDRPPDTRVVSFVQFTITNTVTGANKSVPIQLVWMEPKDGLINYAVPHCVRPHPVCLDGEAERFGCHR